MRQISLAIGLETTFGSQKIHSLNKAPGSSYIIGKTRIRC
jgi:hypothetical protein